jgi:hypothetical protein
MPPWQQEARIDYALDSLENNHVFANHGEQLVCAVLTGQAQPLRSYCDASKYSYCYFRMLELAKYPAVVFRLPIGRWIEEATRRPAVYRCCSRISLAGDGSAALATSIARFVSLRPEAYRFGPH